jgi:hypothetical protein
MKDHIPTFALVLSLGMVLTALVWLALNGKDPAGPVLIGLVGAVGTIVGVIGGFSQQKSPQPPPAGMTSQETTRTTTETPLP